MYLTMYLFKKIYFMVLSDRGRDTERPFKQILYICYLNFLKYNTFMKEYLIGVYGRLVLILILMVSLM